jgi:hypothetical protein
VLATLRDFFGSQIAADLIATSHEAGVNKIDKTGAKKNVDENSGFAEMVRQLNEDTRKAGGNFGLDVLCGQEIESVTIVDIDFADKETEEAFWAPFEAERKGQADLISANYRLKTSTKNAAITRREETAVAETYEKKVAAFGGDSRAAALAILAENLKGSGLQVLGGNALVSLEGDKGGVK